MFAEFIDADSHYENAPARPIDVNRSDMLNLFGDVMVYDGSSGPIWARVGRQELLYGVQRVVSPLDWANTRRTFDGANPDGWVPEEKITLEEALTAYTYGSAYAAFMEQKVGRLEPGKYADLAVLSQDLFQTDPLELPGVEVAMTMVNGEIVYRNEG